MPLTSADKAFGIIALEKKLLTKDALASREAEVLAEREKGGNGLSLAEHLVKKSVLTEEKKQEIEKIRSRHGRSCERCSKDTFLLPGEAETKKPCEHCGGRLRPRTPTQPPRPGAPAAPASAKLKGPPSTGAAAAVAPAPGKTAAPAPEGGAPLEPPRSRKFERIPISTEKPAGSPDAPRGNDDRARKMRLAGGGFGYEPEPKPEPRAEDAAEKKPAEKPPLAGDAQDAAAREARARKMRLAGGGFGYEPPPPAPAAEAQPPAPTDAAPAPAAGDAPAPTEEEAPLETWRPGKPIRDRTGTGRTPTGRATGRTPAPAPPPAGILPSSAVPLSAQWLDILTFPLRGSGLPFVCFAAAIVGVSSWCVKQAATGNIYVVLTCPFWFLALLYFNAYQAKVLNAATAGKTETPDWPDVDETRGLGWRLFCVQIAVFLPFMLLWFHILTSTIGATGGLQSIGPDAHRMASSKSKLVGQSAAEVELLDMEDNPRKLGARNGRWLVLALLDKDTADDTGMSKMIREMPKGSSFTAPYLPGNQIFDLGRVAKALPDVDVAPMFIDPRKKCLASVGLFTRKLELPDDRSPGRGGSGEGEDEDEPRGPKPPDINKLPIPGNGPRKQPGAGGGSGLVSPGYEPFKDKILRVNDLVMPEPFRNPKVIVPTIWLIDPQGKIRKEWDGGAYDQALYATLLDMKRGGNGDVDPQILPLHVYGIEDPWIEMGLCYLLLIAGVLYYPMAFLMSTVFTSNTVAFQYPAGIEAIGKTSRDYIFIAVFLAALLIVGETLATGFSILARNHLAAFVALPLAGFVKWWISCYGTVADCYALGRFYVRNEARLNWLAPGEAAPAVADAMQWRPPSLGGPPGPPVPEPPRPAFEPGPLGKAWQAFMTMPKSAEIAICVVAGALAILGVRAEMGQWNFDADVGRAVGDLNRMQVDVKAKLIEGFAKRGCIVSPDEIQLAAVENESGPPMARVSVRSPGSGCYYCFAMYFGHGGGGGGFEYMSAGDPRLWPAPRSREMGRLIIAVVGGMLSVLFGLKAFWFERRD